MIVMVLFFEMKENMEGAIWNFGPKDRFCKYERLQINHVFDETQAPFGIFPDHKQFIATNKSLQTGNPPVSFFHFCILF